MIFDCVCVGEKTTCLAVSGVHCAGLAASDTRKLKNPPTGELLSGVTVAVHLVAV